MHILIYGTGAVGGMLGTRLALAGENVTFLTRPQYKAQLSQGFTLDMAQGSLTLEHPTVASSLQEVERPIDVTLLCTKAYDLQAALLDLQQHGVHATFVSFLNGVESERHIGDIFGDDNVVPATLTSAVSRPSINHVILSRERGVGFGGSHPLVQELARRFEAAGFFTRTYRSGEDMKWSKMLSNITANAVAAILGWPAGQVFSCDTTYHLELLALKEALSVMRALGANVVPLPRLPLHLLPPALALPNGILRPVLQRMVAGGRGGKPPSFSFDIQRGRSEVGWLNGAIARLGREQAIPAPVNEALTIILMDLVEGRREPASLRDNPDALAGYIHKHRQAAVS